MVRVDGLSPAQAAALREQARLLDVRMVEEWPEGAVISADAGSLATLSRDLPAAHAPVARALSGLVAALAHPVLRLPFKGGELRLDPAAGALVMGVLNVTPDSFSDGGRHAGVQEAVEHGVRLASEGASLVDVGGESARPGAAPVSLDEELSRVIPVVADLRAALPAGVPISIDTMKAEVACQAVAAGAEIINDVSGLSADPAMRETAASLGAYVIVNHMRGVPRNMQESPSYRDVVPEVIEDLSVLVDAALRAGIDAGRIWIDPGIGFGKRHQDNLAILRHMPSFVSLGRPVVVGVSRKSFLAALVDDTGPADPPRADATLAAEVCAMLGGAHVIRTHEPARARRAARVAAAIGSPAPQAPSPR